MQAPVVRSQESMVQALWSMQLTGALGVQTPFTHASPVVQGFLSSQGPVLAKWMQPENLEHPSVVQALPSSQFVGGPGWQAPFTHASPSVQGLLSLHGPLTGAC